MSTGDQVMTRRTDTANLSRYWAKADPSVAPAPRHHAFVAHSLDVAACAYVLIDSAPVLRRRVAQRIGVDERDLAASFAAIVALHDIGKLDTRFQVKAPEVAVALRPNCAEVIATSYDHGVEGFRLLVDEMYDLLLSLLGDQGAALLRAVCGHHGSLPPNAEPAPRTRIPRDLRREDAEARRVWLNAVHGHFTGIGARLPWTPPVDAPLVQQLAGMCAVADWLGSNVEFFEYCQGPVAVESYWPSALARAEVACKSAGLLREAATAADFTTLFPGYSPRDVQVVTERLPLSGPSLVIVEAAMGQGKTEAAFSLASRALAAGLADGVTIGLPTMATSNAMFARVEALAPRLFGGNIQLALAHGRSRKQPLFKRLTHHSLKPRDADAPEASVSCARWLLNRKRILLAQLGVGTIDQTLQAAIKLRHQFVRMFSLSRNIVVLDEIHAYDAYMEVLLDHLLRWLGALDVSVILLSATLPAMKRAALVGAWQGKPSPEAENLDVAVSHAYPLVTAATKDRVELSSVDTGTPDERRRSIGVERVIATSADDKHVTTTVQRLAAAARLGARVAWIRNTVAEAQQAFAALRDSNPDVEATLFHSRFRAEDRERVEERVLFRFGKQCPDGGRVLIATQVVEQSLDLDFDELHSDLAPIDLLLQRSGRLHRHERTARPATCSIPRIVIHLPPTEDARNAAFGPTRHVYDAATLWLTHEIVTQHDRWIVPDDIRSLVEHCYHPAAREAGIARASGRLHEANKTSTESLAARRVNARRVCIPPNEMDADGEATLDDDDEITQALTRDGNSTTLIPVRWDGVAGGALDDSAAEWILDAAAPEAWKLADLLLDQTLSIPQRGQTLKARVEHGQEAWSAWNRRFTSFCDDVGLGRRVVALPMASDEHGYTGLCDRYGRVQQVRYSAELGLEFVRSQEDEV